MEYENEFLPKKHVDLTTSEIVAAACSCMDDWSLENDEFSVERLRGGLTNLLHLVKRKPGSKKPRVQEDEVILLVREFGCTTLGESFMSRSQENRIIQALSAAKLVPRVYGTFPWGRVEEYIQHSRTLTTQEYKSKPYLPVVGKLLGSFHHQRKQLLPLCETEGSGSVLKSRLTKWFQLAVKMKFDHKTSHKVSGLHLSRMKEEIEWATTVAIPGLKSNKVVFSHCDLQEGNILLRVDDAKSLNVNMIDLEYGDRMERGFDIGNCFCEMAICYAVKNFPGFVLHPDDYPEREDQLLFLQGYCEGAELDFDVEKESLLAEAQLFTLMSHLHWSVWSVIMAGHSTIEFGYLEYAQQRMDQYWALKKKFGWEE